MRAERGQASHEQGRYCGRPDVQGPCHPCSTVEPELAAVLVCKTRLWPAGPRWSAALPRCEVLALARGSLGTGTVFTPLARFELSLCSSSWPVSPSHPRAGTERALLGRLSAGPRDGAAALHDRQLRGAGTALGLSKGAATLSRAWWLCTQNAAAPLSQEGGRVRWTRESRCLPWPVQRPPEPVPI